MGLHFRGCCIFFLGKGRGLIYILGLNWGRNSQPCSITATCIYLCVGACLYAMGHVSKTALWIQFFHAPVCGFWGSAHFISLSRQVLPVEAPHCLRQLVTKFLVRPWFLIKTSILFTHLVVSFVASCVLLLSLHDALLMSQ